MTDSLDPDVFILPIFSCDGIDSSWFVNWYRASVIDLPSLSREHATRMAEEALGDDGDFVRLMKGISFQTMLADTGNHALKPKLLSIIIV